MATRILIINRQLKFAVTLKQALEQTGLFDVHPFTSAEAAFDFLRDHPQDVALVDYELPGRSGAKVVGQLRALQPDLAIIISPRQPDGETLIAGLRLQGMIDMPFGARDVIPLLEAAIEAMQNSPPSAAPPANKFDVEPSSVMPTKALDEPAQDDLRKRQFGSTQRFQGDQPDAVEAENLPQTRLFDESAPESPNQSRVINDSPPPSRKRAQAKTRDLSGEPPPSEPGKTQNLPDAPPSPPEFASLENVLKSFGFEPPPGEHDTPAVPMQNSDALRQFLATTGDVGDAERFDGVLGAINPDDYEVLPRRLRDAEFTGLVRSLSSDEEHTSLPGRQQQAMDFILTSGMDEVLREIARSKTGPLDDAAPPPPDTMPEEPREPKKPKGIFQKLAAEEPPMPEFEEGGTVSDLMLGVRDRSFRNVLSLLRGDEVEESSRYSSITAAEDRYADFYGSSTSSQKSAEVKETPPQSGFTPSAAEPPAFDFDYLSPEDAEEATVAQVVLKTTLDEVTAEGFSLNQLLGDIQNRLSLFRLTVKPLPSWQLDSGIFRPVNEDELREPDFLPEELPTGEVIPPELPPEVIEPESYTGRTTQASLASQQTITHFTEDEDTMVDSSYLDETSPSEVLATSLSEEPLPPSALPEAEPTAAAPAHWLSGLVDETAPAPELAAEGDEALPGEYIPDDRFEETAGQSSVWLAEPETPLAEESAEWTPVGGLPAVTDDDLDAIAAQEQQTADWDSWDEPEPELQPEADSWELPAAEPQPVPDSWDLPAPETSDESAIPEDPYIAHLALHLTQVSLEVSAEGTLLTSANEVIAYAGHLSQDDALELRDVVANDWNANPEGARIRFVTLPGSGRDYMLYSIRTVNDLTLSMIFAGTTPLRVIRQQGQKLIAALEAIPETAVEALLPPPVEAAPPLAVEPVYDEPLSAYACVWLLRDPENSLNNSVAQAITAGLTMQLRELRWKLDELQVHEDFVYVLVGIPGEKLPNEIIRELKRRSAEIAHAQNPDLTPQLLWADAYLILTPGRTLSTEEILEFINFQRM